MAINCIIDNLTNKTHFTVSVMYESKNV